MLVLVSIDVTCLLVRGTYNMRPSASFVTWWERGLDGDNYFPSYPSSSLCTNIVCSK